MRAKGFPYNTTLYKLHLLLSPLGCGVLVYEDVPYTRRADGRERWLL